MRHVTVRLCVVKLTRVMLVGVSVLLAACGGQADTSDANRQALNDPAGQSTPEDQSAAARAGTTDAFEVEAERFADLRVLRYRVSGFNELGLRTKKLLYYLCQAALSGRDIIYDQKYRYNLAIRRTLEQVVRAYPGDRGTDDFKALQLYLKRIWFSNGIHHHYANDKFDPGFGYDAFVRIVKSTPGPFPVRDGQTVDALLEELRAPMFDPEVDAKLVDKRGGIDVVERSAVNFYRGVTQQQVEDFYAAKKQPESTMPLSLGLNSQLVERNGELTERVWKVGGMYTQVLEHVVAWLEKAAGVAENDTQRRALQELIRYYRTGDLKVWDDYNVAWVEDSDSLVDAINGFIEVYNDPMGLRGSFESVVSFRDPVATRRIEMIADNAQWFEDHSPIMDAHKKAHVQGITGKVVNVVVESGDSSPATPIGINLPNADWIRRQHGSKSVSLQNIVTAYNVVSGEAEKEFAWDADEAERADRYGDTVSNLMTEMHEVIGHASGRLEAGVAPLHETLKNYGSTLEEARADLVALYYIIDPKLVELGLLPSVEAGHIAYDRYIRNGLMQQLNRIVPGNDLEEDHMRNRQLVAGWAYDNGRAEGVIERQERDSKTYFVVTDYQGLRELFGRLLRELQRIKSQGDFAAIRDLVERYGVKVDRQLNEEVRRRYARLDIPPYSGFINPRLAAVEQGGQIVDVNVEYPDDFTRQMLDYSDRYSFLPTWN